MDEIIKGVELNDKLKKGVNKLSDAVLTTYGPYGKTVLIADDYDRPYVTKDGVSVANYVTLKDPIENMAAILLKEVAQKTVDQAGDGTTTSICIANALINKGYELLQNGYDYGTIKKQLIDLESIVVAELKYRSISLDRTNIIDVATISSNNDKELATLIEKAYNHSNVVKVKESNNVEDELITISGMKLNGGYYNKAFINNIKKQSIEYNKPTLIIVKGNLDSLNKVGDFLTKNNNKDIVIMADNFSEEVVTILKSNYNKGALKIGLVKSPGFAQHRKDLIEDIIIYTRATLTNEGYYLAELTNLIATKDSLIISKKNGQENTLKLTKELEVAILNNEIDSGSKKLLQDRLNNIKGNISIINVGGLSESEMKEKKDRVDDAVLAVSCAIEEGIITGGGLTLKRIGDSLEDSILFKECLSDPYKFIFRDINECDISIDEDIVIDPVKVTRCAVQNAISVAKVILSTDAVVLNERIWN